MPENNILPFCPRHGDGIQVSNEALSSDKIVGYTITMTEFTNYRTISGSSDAGILAQGQGQWLKFVPAAGTEVMSMETFRPSASAAR